MHGLKAARAIWLLGAATLLGCGGDGPTGPAISEGSLSFTYSGAMSGSFDVKGALVPSYGGRPPDGAGAFRDGLGPPITLIAARRTRSATRADFFDLLLPGPLGTGTVIINDGSCVPGQMSCVSAFVGVDLPIEPPSLETEPPEGFFVFTSGTITITSVSGTRMSGTFSGTAESLTLSSETIRVITVTNGQFDVPISTPPFG